MSAAGELNRRLVLEAPVESSDGSGGVTRAFTTVTTLWAQVLPQAMRADVSADALGAALRYRIVIRKRTDVTIRHRLRDGGDIYRILAARVSEDRAFLEIDAEIRED
jgi:SPP1 family predicted phage head-tail adaptor